MKSYTNNALMYHMAKGLDSGGRSYCSWKFQVLWGHWWPDGLDSNLLTWSHEFEFKSHQCQGIFSSVLCVTPLLWSPTPENEEVIHCILWRRCKAVGPGGPVSITPRLSTCYFNGGNPKGWVLIYRQRRPFCH